MFRYAAALAAISPLLAASFAHAAPPDYRLFERNLPAPSDEARLPAAAAARTAILALSPRADHDGFAVDVILDPGGGTVNAAAAIVRYPAETLEFAGFDDAAAEFSFYLDEDGAVPGRISVSAAQPYPGFSERKLLARLKFKFKKEAPALISAEAGSMALANDGYGTEVLRYRTGTLVSPAEAE